jgi:hypothetical protein
MAIGLADRDIVDAIFILLVGGQNALGGETVDRGHHRGFDQPREGERHEIGLVVNQVEVPGLFKDVGDVERLPPPAPKGRSGAAAYARRSAPAWRCASNLPRAQPGN